MAEYRLLENAFAAPAMGSLFQSAAFHRLHAGEAAAFFEWEHEGTVVASIHFTALEGGLWRSPARGTFGGFACRPELRLDVLFEFHDAVLARLAARGATRVEILPAPMAHDPVAFSNQMYLLRSRGYETGQCDLNHSLQVDERSLGERMSYGNLKRLRKCAREGLSAQLLPAQALGEVYDTLAANRAANGHALSMTLAQLEHMGQHLPDAFALFGCRHGEQLAAAALCLRLSAEVLYVFYWGDRPGYASLSPVVAVADAIYTYCQAQGFQLLDVGTSTVDREPNFGLVQFKRGLGFSESLKVRAARSV